MTISYKLFNYPSEINVSNISHLLLIKHPENVVEIKICDENLTHLPEYLFNNFRFLLKLTLTNNNLNYIYNKQFLKLKRLEYLDLSSNILNSIKFPCLSNLKELNLSNNNFHSGKINVKKLKKLKKLNLENCKINNLKSNIFIKNDNLVNVLMSKNPLLQKDINKIKIGWFHKFNKILIDVNN